MAKMTFTYDSETGESKLVVNDQAMDNIDSLHFYQSDYCGPSVSVRTKRQSEKALSVSYEVAMASQKDLSSEGYTKIGDGMFGRKVDEITELGEHLKKIM